MKYLSLILLLFSSSSWACINQLPESEIIKAVALTPGAGTVSCAQKPDEACVCFDGIPGWEVMAYGLVTEDDPSRPIFEAASNVQACGSAEACAALIATQGFCPETHTPFYRELPPAFEAYCTRLLGYEQIQVTKLHVDPVKLATKQAADASAEADRLNRLAKFQARRAPLKQCVQDLKGSATAAQVKACLLLLLKDALADELASSEL